MQSDTLSSVLFIHGLTGHREKTWTKGEAEPWPKSLLPRDLPTARIIMYGYDADILRLTDKNVGQNTIQDHAKNLINDLCALRKDAIGRPIIFVAHSLGGLIIQDALQSCTNPNDEIQSDILSSTRGVAFLGTPHAGADVEKFATAVANVVGLVKRPNKKVLKVLNKHSETLARVKDGFHTMVMRRLQDPQGNLNPIELHAFIEEKPVKKYMEYVS
jgi:pimeloyl-ACP methyl ester carboxylesterase